MPDLVVLNINGAQSLRIEYAGKSVQQTIGIEERRIAISDGEAALGLDKLRILYEGGAFR